MIERSPPWRIPRAAGSTRGCGGRNRTVGELAASVRITQPAASQHLRVLTSARLTTIRRDGTRRYYRADPRGLADLRRYIESLWDDVLQAFAAADPAPPRGKEPR